MLDSAPGGGDRQSGESRDGLAPLRSAMLASADAAGTDVRIDLWLEAARRGDIAALTRLVRDGFDVIDAADATSGTSALHAVSALAREDCICAIFELARGVGGATVHDRGHRDWLARRVMDQVDSDGRNAMHYAATAADTCGASYIHAAIARLDAYGVSDRSVDKNGALPVDIAHDMGNQCAAAALEMLKRRDGS